MTRPKRLKQFESGFTLVELMVVVAIIGILASVAISNYRNYQAKSRQSEVKIKLASAYTAEQSFFGVHGTYSACLANIGFEISAGARHYYLIGPGDSVASGCGPNGSTGCDYYGWDNSGNVVAGMQCAAVTDGQGGTGFGFLANASMTPGSLPTWSEMELTTQSINQNTFIFGAAGMILPNVPSVPGSPVSCYLNSDVWTIDQNKNIINVHSLF